jgi:hypothetical protein
LRHFSRKPLYSGGSARHIGFGIPQIYSRTSDRFRRVLAVHRSIGERPAHHTLNGLFVAHAARHFLLLDARDGQGRTRGTRRKGYP